MKLKLSERLSWIYENIEPHDALWDIGADHGKIGFKALIDHKSDKVYFVDKSKQVIDGLNNTFKSSINEKLNSKYDVGFYCLNGLALKKYFGSLSGTIVMAGFGGKNMMNVFDNLPKVKKGTRIIVAPHTDEKFVSYHLLNKSYILLKKTVITENKRQRYIFCFQNTGN